MVTFGAFLKKLGNYLFQNLATLVPKASTHGLNEALNSNLRESITVYMTSFVWIQLFSIY